MEWTKQLAIKVMEFNSLFNFPCSYSYWNGQTTIKALGVSLFNFLVPKLCRANQLVEPGYVTELAIYKVASHIAMGSQVTTKFNHLSNDI